MRKGRLSNRRSDARFVAPDGTLWDSEYEYAVCRAFVDRGAAEVRKTVKGSSDTFAYTRAKRSSECLECGSSRVVQRCTYTPDLHIRTNRSEYWVEAKGFFSQQKRAAFRDFKKQNQGVDVRFVASNNHKIGKGRLDTYFASYLPGVPLVLASKTKVLEALPEEWFK